MKALLDLAQTGAIIVLGGSVMYVVLLIRRTNADFDAASARCRVELAESRLSAEEVAQEARRERFFEADDDATKR